MSGVEGGGGNRLDAAYPRRAPIRRHRSDDAPLVERLCVVHHDTYQSGTLWTDLPLPIRVKGRAAVRALLDELDRTDPDPRETP